MKASCSGCTKTFSRQADLTQHLLKSKNPVCIEVRNRLAESTRRPYRRDQPHPRFPSSAPGPSRLGPNNSLPDDPAVEDFAGDFFGQPEDYSEHDFPVLPPQENIEDVPPAGLHTDNNRGRVTESDSEESSDDEAEVTGCDIEVPVSRHDQPMHPSIGGPSHGAQADNLPLPPPSPPPDVPRDGISAADLDALRQAPQCVQPFGGRAGEQISDPTIKVSAYNAYGSKVTGSEDNPYAPFASQMDWEVAQWEKERGSGSTAFTDLLKIKGLVEALGLSYKNSRELNAIIDEKIPHRRPAFTHHNVTIGDERLDLFARDILECIRALYGDPEHARYLCFTPERHYADSDRTIRLYHDLHTGRWWWETQKAVEADTPGATIIPVILSSDKTQITLFRNKSAYPVYLTIGNLPKSIRRKPGRRGQILLAYLPTNRLEHYSNKASRRRSLANIFHACMGHLLKPLVKAGISGVPMMSGDGVWRRCHPILAVYVGDYPEQCLVTGAYTGDCPVCECPHDELETYPNAYDYRDPDAVLDALQQLGSPSFERACRDANIKPIQHPFWEPLPYLNIFRSITPDILHQLHQGVFKHLVSWLKTVCGAEEIDARVSRLPPNHGIRIFWKGISKLSRMSRFLLGIIVDMPLPGGRAVTNRLLRATRGLLDFLYLAQYPIHSDESLSALEDALSDFHAHRDVFITLNARDAFNIPKLHFLLHYVDFVKLFGTTDNYNTEATERLHIDFAKEAYRATNHKDEYPQMTKWLERREKMAHHANYVLWRLQQAQTGPSPLSAHHDQRWTAPDLAADLQIKMTRNPTRKAITLAEITSPFHYGATFFIPALARFVVQWTYPTLAPRQVEEKARYVHIPFATLPVYHRIKFWNEDIYGKETIDSIHVHPRKLSDNDDLLIPARFDTALVRIDHGLGEPEPGLSGQTHLTLFDTQVAQVRIVFSLPDAAVARLFPALPQNRLPPRHLAYIEWFTPFRDSPEPHSGLYSVKRLVREGGRVASIVPVAFIQRSVHLIPKWGGRVPVEWTSGNVLDECPAFYLNTFKDIHSYFNVK
ncbi:hypothetical protein GY45DRAFT_1349365 [Cubamyces sp. BRFM 1775]|nr:hypothetical protein GY45DRAFT_1349365 [Cubamyces sp. BRFM 1775]